MLQVLKEHSEVTANIVPTQQDPSNDRYQAFYVALMLYRMAESRITNNLASFSQDKISIIQDYSLSKRQKNDFLALKRTLKYN